MSNPKLLLADDSIAIRKVVELTFADEGIDVFAVPDAQSAMQKFIEVQPDIVLVDAGLEGTSGYQICEMIKQDEQTKHIPVLLLVGSFEPFDKEAADQACSDGFLTKPFQSIRELVNRVDQLLHRNERSEVSAADIHAPPTEGTPVPVVDTEDIESLYQSSFEQTAEIEEYDTIEDVFDDEGLDDELIDTTRPEIQRADAEQAPAETTEPLEREKIRGVNDQQGAEESAAFHDGATLTGSFIRNDLGGEAQPAAGPEDAGHAAEDEVRHREESRTVDELGGGYESASEDEAATVKEFDWSPAAKVEEPPEDEADEFGFQIFHNAPSVSLGAADGEPDDETGLASKDSMPEAETADDPFDTNADPRDDGADAQAEGTEAEHLPETQSPGQPPSVEDSKEPATGDLDELAPGINEDGETTTDEASDADHIFPPVSGVREPSPEFIALVAQRVIERLSDHIIREVAQEAVPRITEKLIREALEQEARG